MWDKTLLLLQSIYQGLEPADQARLGEIGSRELAGLRASCANLPFLAGALVVLRTEIKPFPGSLFMVGAPVKWNRDGVGEFTLTVHPAFFLLSKEGKPLLEAGLEKADPKLAQPWKREYANARPSEG